MEGGEGEDSYCLNSNIQARAFQVLSSFITRALQHNQALKASRGHGELVRIADIGCSSGRNTITAMEFVIDEIVRTVMLADKPGEFMVYFSDLPANDFNTLFGLMLPDHAQGKPYFYAAVPGSFSQRLFPSSSIHFVMSSFALHWLTEVPEEVKDENSLAWNAGRAFVDGYSSKEAIQAFAQQAHKDLLSFLQCRAEELLPGGTLTLIFTGRRRDSQHDIMVPAFQAVWEELIEEELVQRKSLDSFNIPIYLRSREEIETALRAAGGFKICEMGNSTSDVFEDKSLGARHFKALTKPLVERHLGDAEFVEELYKRYFRRQVMEEAGQSVNTFTLVLMKTE